MKRTDTSVPEDALLESFFVAARAQRIEPSDGLMARIMADAEAELAARGTPVAPASTVPLRRGLIAAIAAAIGGWPAVATMATAAVAGVWLGFASPDSLNTLSGGILLPTTTDSGDYQLEDLLPGYDSLAGLYEEG